MLQLENKTPFAASFAPFPNEQGIDSIYLMVKGTFKLGQKWTLADEQVPPQEADEYYTDPLTSSIKFASDYHIGKKGTDVVVVGSAMAKDRRQIKALDVNVSVANREKQIRVFGDRFWDGGNITEPQAFETLPIVYERAFGGIQVDDSGNVVAAELRNPVGTGFFGKHSHTDIEGIALPNLEDPRYPIQSSKDISPVVGFGFIAPNWQPRVGFAGTYDESWQENRAPFLPRDFSRKFLNAAHPDLVFDHFFMGGEAISISNMNEMGELRFQLPSVNLKSIAKVGNNIVAMNMNLETVTIQPNDLMVSLSWRGELVCEKNVNRVSMISVTIQR